jgi:cardiolipin synthase (CMP-forming)
MRELPNILTVLRILLIPVIMFSFFLETKTGYWVAASIFIFASITDYFDGMLARALNAQTSFGRILDPIADKLLVAATLMMMVSYEKAPVIPAILILCREIVVSGLREYLAQFKLGMPVSGAGKIKTAIQFIAIFVLIISQNDSIIYKFGEVLIWVAAILTLITGYAYCKEGFRKII